MIQETHSGIVLSHAEAFSTPGRPWSKRWPWSDALSVKTETPRKIKLYLI